MKYMKIIIWILVFVVLGIACGSKPEVYTQKKTSFKPYKTLAILPFSNYSGKEDAGKQVSNAFLVELLKKPFFKILEPGQVDKVLRDERIRSSDQIDIQTAQLLKEKLAVDYLLIGAVNEYDYLKNGEREIPLIGFSARLLDTSDGHIIWAANHSRKGDDSELIFNWGLITSLTKLTQISVKDVTDRLKIEQ
jgi:TolB-like protein